MCFVFVLLTIFFKFLKLIFSFHAFFSYDAQFIINLRSIYLQNCSMNGIFFFIHQKMLEIFVFDQLLLQEFVKLITFLLLNLLLVIYVTNLLLQVLFLNLVPSLFVLIFKFRNFYGFSHCLVKIYIIFIYYFC